MKQEGKILIVDDDKYVLLSVQILLEQHFSFVRVINNPSQIDSALEAHQFDVVVLDMNFRPGNTSGEEGLKWLKSIKNFSPKISVVLITAYGDIEIAVEAIKQGAFDFVVKPWENEKLVSTVAAAYKLSHSQQKVEQLTTQTKLLSAALDAGFGQMLGQSAAIKQIKTSINKVAATDASVLILGENGTGKELVARELHTHSHRKKEVFIGVDMGAIVPSLFESELFGHVKGAFTSAQDDRMGKFEAAANGTLFLDEIGNLPPEAQAKLLKAIQEKTITRVGSNQPIQVDIRIISATNKDLYQMVAQGLFREDLLYRLNTVEIALPPLRDRNEDILPLAEHFLERFKKKYNKKGLYVPEYVITKLKKHSWPGNIRELEHCIERAVIMSDGKQLHVKDLALSLPSPKDDLLELDNFNLEKLEKWAILKVLQKYGGNISHAAEELGLSRGALYRRMEKYEI